MVFDFQPSREFEGGLRCWRDYFEKLNKFVDFENLVFEIWINLDFNLFSFQYKSC